MGTTEWILLVLVFLIPLVIAVPVTLWSLEQARKRSKPTRTDRIRRRVELPQAEEHGTRDEGRDEQGSGQDATGSADAPRSS